MLSLGTLLFALLEDWSALESLYFCVNVATTVGLGDYVPATAWGRAICVLYALSVLGVAASVLSSIGDHMSHFNLKSFKKSITPSHKSSVVAGDGSAKEGPPNPSTQGSAVMQAVVPPGGVAIVRGAGAIDVAAAHSHGADVRWTMVAASAMSRIQSRRGDTLRSLVPRAACAFVAFAVLVAAGGAIFTTMEREPEQVREAEFATWSDMVGELQSLDAVISEQKDMLGGMLSMANPNAAARAAAVRASAATPGAAGDVVSGVDVEGSAASASSGGEEAADAPAEFWNWQGAAFFALTVVTCVHCTCRCSLRC